MADDNDGSSGFIIGAGLVIAGILLVRTLNRKASVEEEIPMSYEGVIAKEIANLEKMERENGWQVLRERQYGNGHEIFTRYENHVCPNCDAESPEICSASGQCMTCLAIETDTDDGRCRRCGYCLCCSGHAYSGICSNCDSYDRDIIDSDDDD